MKKNIRRNQQGFTLIELLVVIAILAVLFGVTALALNGVGSNAEVSAAKGERDVVQTAIDTYLAVNTANGVYTVAPQGCIQPSDTTPTGISSYLRRSTKFFYGWTASGQVTGVFKSTSSPCDTPLTLP